MYSGDAYSAARRVTYGPHKLPLGESFRRAKMARLKWEDLRTHCGCLNMVITRYN